MQKIIQALPILVIVVAIGIITYYVVEDRKAKQEPEPKVTVAEKVLAKDLPVSEELSEADHQVVSKAFASPEDLDAPASPEAVTVKPASKMEPIPFPEAELSEKSIVSKPEDTTPPYFHDAFASLRTDAVKNPDSTQNRATVKTIMQKRQQRLAHREQ